MHQLPDFPLFIYKPVGITPLQALDLLKNQLPQLAKYKLTYAGRLDPLAEGVLPVVTGKDFQQKTQLMNETKKYEAEILMGISTDSGDILGLPKNNKLSYNLNEQKIKTFLDSLYGKILLPLPFYSSPLISQHKLKSSSPATIQNKQMEILKTEFISKSQITQQDIINKLNHIYSKLDGKFREAAIITSWNNLKMGNLPLTLYKVNFEVKSGTYIRSIAEYIGNKFNTPSCLYSLKRTHVGKFSSKNCLKLKI